MLAFLVALCGAPTAHAAALLQKIVITPSSGCGLLTAYVAGTGLPAWSGPAPSCGTGGLTLGFNQGNTPPPVASPNSRGVAMAGSALAQAWRLTGVPDGARMGYQIAAPPGITINEVVYDDSQLQNIANARGWIGFTYWNGGTASVHPNGTALDAADSGPRWTLTWTPPTGGSSCGASRRSARGRVRSSSASLTVYATETQGPSIAPSADPTSLWNQHGWVWNPPGDAWPLPLTATDPGGICSLSVQAGASPPVADPSLPGPTDSSWQECEPVSWTAAVDTSDYVSSSAQLPITLAGDERSRAPECDRCRKR